MALRKLHERKSDTDLVGGGVGQASRCAGTGDDAHRCAGRGNCEEKSGAAPRPAVADACAQAVGGRARRRAREIARVLRGTMKKPAVVYTLDQFYAMALQVGVGNIEMH